MLLESPGFVVLHLQKDFEGSTIRQMRTKVFLPYQKGNKLKIS